MKNLRADQNHGMPVTIQCIFFPPICCPRKKKKKKKENSKHYQILYIELQDNTPITYRKTIN
jgi:hypothetical protein